MHDSDENFLNQILNSKFSNALDSEWNFLQRFGFWIKFFTTCQVCKEKLFSFRRESLTYIHHMNLSHLFPPDTMSSSSLQYPHSRDKRNHRLNNNLCTHFHKKFKCCFYSAVPLFSQYGLYICKIWLPRKVQQKLELSLCHTCLTSSEKNSDDIETFWLPVKKPTHAQQQFIQTKTYEQVPAHFQSVFQKDDFWATWEVQSDAQTLELLEKSSPSLPSRTAQLGFQMILAGLSRPKFLVKREYLSPV